MVYALVKVALSAVIIVVVSEVAKRWSLFGGLIASLPLVTLLAMIWLYADTRDPERIAKLSVDVFWLVLPSLSLFIALPLFLRRTELGFAISLALSVAIMLVCYGAMLGLLRLLR